MIINFHLFRVFIITLSLNDDSLLVYEPTVRNSGTEKYFFFKICKEFLMANFWKRENIRMSKTTMNSSLQ